MSNTGPAGNLDQDRFLRAILQLRNTPDPGCHLSPAQIIFGRPLRDSLSFVNKLEKFSNPNVRPLWRDAWAAKEEALRTRITRTTEALKAHSRPLRPLTIGERVLLQNQRGHHPTKWDRSGTVLESPGHDQYRVKVDGSGRLTLRNRRFLRAYTPATSATPQQLTTPPQPGSRADQQPYQQSRSSPLQSEPMPRAAVEAPATIPTDDLSSQVTTDTMPERDLVGQANPETLSSVPQVNPGTLSSVPPPVLPPDLHPRPSRFRRPPKRFEPETGKWI